MSDKSEKSEKSDNESEKTVSIMEAKKLEVKLSPREVSPRSKSNGPKKPKSARRASRRRIISESLSFHGHNNAHVKPAAKNSPRGSPRKKSSKSDIPGVDLPKPLRNTLENQEIEASPRSSIKILNSENADDISWGTFELLFTQAATRLESPELKTLFDFSNYTVATEVIPRGISIEDVRIYDNI